MDNISYKKISCKDADRGMMRAHPAHRLDMFYALFLIVLLFSGLSAIVYWAAHAEIEQISRAQGQLIASERTQVIQATRTGVISELKVREGDFVQQNQVLAVLDNAQEKAALQDVDAKIAALEVTLARLEAEVYDTPLTFDSDLARDYAEFVQNQRSLFNRRLQALNDEVASYEANLVFVREELALLQRLEKTGDVGRSDVLNLLRQEQELMGKISAAQNNYLRDAQAEMTKAEEDLSEQRSLRVERLSHFGRTEVLSPVDGQVKAIALTTRGAAVAAGDMILELVPNGDLILEVKLKPVDISYIINGLPVSVKLDAFDFTIFGSLKGEVVYVSPDALMEKTPEGEVPYYRVQVLIFPESIEERNRHNKRQIVVQPGMTATAEIVTGQRSVLAYLTKPIIKTVSESMGER